MHDDDDDIHENPAKKGNPFACLIQKSKIPGTEITFLRHRYCTM